MRAAAERLPRLRKFSESAGGCRGCGVIEGRSASMFRATGRPPPSWRGVTLGISHRGGFCHAWQDAGIGHGLCSGSLAIEPGPGVLSWRWLQTRWLAGPVIGRSPQPRLTSVE